MKKRIYALLFIGIFSFLLLIYMFPYNFMPKQEIANNVPVQKRALAKYTYISYVCADNNLENYGKMDVNEMEAGFNDSVTDVNVITLLDILNGETTAYYISHDDQPSVITSTMLLIEGLTPEENMGDPNTLVTYVNWCMTYYPAEHYILDLWDHGNGWAVCFDESSGDDAITMAELRDALDQINSSTGNKIDILCMDACLMGTLEVAYEIHDYAAILIASEDAVVATGFPYDDIIADLCANPDQNITEFASATVDLFHNHIIFFNPSTLSAVNLSLVETALIPSFVSFAQNLHLYLNYGIKNELYNARAASEEFYYPQFIDLYDFTQKTKIQATNATIQLLAQNLLDNISPAIINEKHFNNPGAHGLSLYFPELQNSYSSAYATSFSLSNDTMWDDFLVKYYTSANFGLGLRFFAINDSLGNNNETPDPGETVLLDVTLENVGGITAGFVNGTLICLDTTNVTINNPVQNYGNISVQSNHKESYQFNLSVSCMKDQVIPFIIKTESIFNTYSVVRNFTFELVIGRKITIGGSSLENAPLITDNFIYGLLPGLGTNRETWLKIGGSKNLYLFLNLTGPPLTDFDIYVYDPLKELVSVAGKAEYPDACCFLLLADGYYYIKIDPFSGSGYYNLFINLTTEPYEDGTFFGLAFTLPETSTVDGTLPGPASNNYIYYRVIVPTDRQLIVRLTGPAGADFDLYIYNPQLTKIDSSTSPQSSESCQLLTRDSGYYYIVIVPYQGSGAFTLHVEVKNLSFPPWLLTLIIALIVVSVLLAIAYYFIIARKSRDLASAHYNYSDLSF